MKLVVLSLVLVPITVMLAGRLVVGFCGSHSGDQQGAPLFAYNCHGDMSDLKPCHCEYTMCDHVETYTLVCEKLLSERDIRSPLATTLRKYPQMNAFRLKDSIFKSLPSKAFKGLKFKTLEFTTSILSAFTDSDLAFVGLEHELQYLNLTSTIVQRNWNWSIFRKLNSLKHLKVSGLIINTLDKVPGDSQLRLETVEFSYCSITRVHLELFQNSPDLISVSFNNNDIQGVKRTMFPIPAAKLEQVDLSFNNIETLPDDMFTDMPALKIVIVESIKIRTLGEKTFRPVKNTLTFLNAHRNNILCDCNLLWTHGIKFVLYGTCAKPRRLRGREVSSLKPEEMVC